MTPRELEEYTALRATIRQRGSMRIWLFLVGLIGWAALAVATAALAALPVATLLPLLILAAVFDVVYAIHIAVERIGRYIQVFLEDEGAGWEHVAMITVPPAHAIGPDPLFSLVFLGAAALNFVPVLLAEPVPMELGVVGALHGAFAVRVVLARRAASRLRAIDLQRYEQIKAGRMSDRRSNPVEQTPSLP